MESIKYAQVVESDYGIWWQDDSELHFGLGSISSIDSLLVHWPSGTRNMYYTIQPNNHWQLIEDGSIQKIK